MKAAPWFNLERYRLKGMGERGQRHGAFRIPFQGRDLHVIASDGVGEGIEDLGEAWEHVSATLPNRCPNWAEMSYLKEAFWDDHETVMQLHPPKSTYVNYHPYCLHLWKPVRLTIPVPPIIYV